LLIAICGVIARVAENLKTVNFELPKFHSKWEKRP
jgi:hypothetical protein